MYSFRRLGTCFSHSGLDFDAFRNRLGRQHRIGPYKRAVSLWVSTCSVPLGFPLGFFGFLCVPLGFFAFGFLCRNCPLRAQCHPTMTDASRKGRKVRVNEFMPEFVKAREKSMTSTMRQYVANIRWLNVNSMRSPTITAEDGLGIGGWIKTRSKG